MTTGLERLAAALADRYRLERELGQGGMATVYLAQDLKHDRKVALKVLRPELAAVIGAERFLQEIKTTANLQHPHILALFDSGTVEGTVFYVMPYVEGESLRDRLTREKQLPIEAAVRIATEVAGALQYAHERGVIHRDIKPENILLHGGSALVADFGIALAAATTGGSRMTETGMSLGTPHYMSPEQAMGERALDARSDIYALGCVLYEMLLGEPPFSGPTPQSIVAKVMTEKPAPLIPRRDRVPPAVEGAVLTALEKLPADRFASAAEFARALTEPAHTRRHATQGGPPARALSRIAWLAGAGGLVLGVLAGWLVLRPPPPAAVPQVRVVMAPDSAAPAAVQDCCAPAVAIAPDGKRFAYSSRRGGVATVYLRDRDGFVPVVLYEGGKHPFFSPDGRRVGLVAGVGGSASTRPVLVVGSVDGGGWSTVTALPSQDLVGAAWLDDGTIVLGEYQAWQGLKRVTIDGGAVEALTVPDTAAGEERHVAPRFVPEANGILFTIWMQSDNPAEARIGFLSLADRRVRVLGRGLGPQYTRAGYLLSATPQGVVNAQRVDLRTGKASGELVRLAEGISVRGGWTADYAAAGDGTLVSDQGHSEASVEIVSREGVGRHMPIALDGLRHWDNPRFSPDGGLVAAAGSAREGHLAFVLDLARGTGLRLTFEGNTEFLDWGPDGRTIVSVQANTRLVEQTFDRSGTERVLWKGNGGILGRVSVNGRWIAVARTTPGTARAGSDILAIHRDSTEPRPYLATRFEESAPAISPDGRWLAYVSDEAGRQEVYVGAFPDAALGRRVVSTDGAGEPQWSRDGRHLYYRTHAGMLVEHDVRTAPTLSIGPPRALFSAAYDVSDDAADYDVRPAGDGFVMVTTRSIGSRLVWILNAVPAR